MRACVIVDLLPHCAKVFRMSESSPEYVDAIDWIVVAQQDEMESAKYESELSRKEQELNRLRKELEEERKCGSMRAERQYRLEREVRQLRRRVSQWEAEEEERKRMKERIGKEKKS